MNDEAAAIHLPIAEIHTSELTANCLRAVQLRHEGKWEPHSGTAMMRGDMFGKAAEWVHNNDAWHADKAVPAVLDAMRRIKLEPDTLSDAAKRDINTIGAEVQRAIQAYISQFKDYFARCKLIGTEVPIRWQIDGREFASHLDLIFREEWDGGALRVWDWKWTKDAPTQEYIARNLQMASYWWAVKHGEVMLGDDWWQDLDEYPLVSMVYVPHLMPYKKATKRGDTQYKAGDRRPIESIVITADHSDEGAVLDALRERIALMDGGIWPTNPNPVGCLICESRRWCPRFDGRNL